MKRYFIVFTVCMALMLVGLCVMLKFVCLGNLTRAAVAFVLMSVSGILSYLVYRTYDVIKDMKSHYEYFGLDDGTAYMGLQNDTRLDLYFGSLPVRQLREDAENTFFCLTVLMATGNFPETRRTNCVLTMPEYCGLYKNICSHEKISGFCGMRLDSLFVGTVFGRLAFRRRLILNFSA